MTQITTELPDVKLDQLVGFRIERRDYESVEVRNVSLESGLATQVAVENVLTRLVDSPFPHERGKDGRTFQFIELTKVSPLVAKDAIDSLSQANQNADGSGFQAELDVLRMRILLRCNQSELQSIRKFLVRLGEPLPGDETLAPSDEISRLHTGACAAGFLRCR